MAPRKKKQTPSDETPEVTNDEPAVETPETTFEPEPETGEATDTMPADKADPDTVEAADTPEASASDDSIELPEPDRPEETPDLAVGAEDDTIGSAAEDSPTVHDDTIEATTPPAETVTEPQAAPASRGGFVPMVLGGVVAAAIGWFAATQMNDTQDVNLRLDEQDSALSDLRSSIPAPQDLSGIEGATQTNAAAIAELQAQLGDLSTRMTALSEQMTALEKATVENAVSEGAMQAYEDELARLQAAMRTQREEVEAMVTQAQQVKATADAQSAQTEARAALTAIIATFDTGESYAEPLAALEASGQQVPAALSDNAEGIATLASLRADFPAAARDALAVSRGTGSGSVGDFFRTQLGVRSLEPKEGDDPDAILSRAESALSAGNLATALEEIATLPADAQAEFADWSAAAETRLTTVEAANGLMADLNSN